MVPLAGDDAKKRVTGEKTAGQAPLDQFISYEERDESDAYPKQEPEPRSRSASTDSSATLGEVLRPHSNSLNPIEDYKPNKISHSASVSANAKVLTILECLDSFDQITRRRVQNLDLSTTEDMSPALKQLWMSSTTTWPQILSSSQCWAGDRPTSTDLLFHTIDKIAATKLAEEQDRVDDYKEHCPAFSKGLLDPHIDRRTANAQLYEPNQDNPVALLGYQLPDLIPDGALSTPETLAEFVEAFDERNTQVFLTPKCWVTDLHLDNSDGISTTIAPTEKVWMMFPPTPKNLQLMQRADAQHGKLVRIGAELKGGLIFHTTSRQAIYIPIGCIHGVFTTHGGFLLSMEFSTPESARVLAALLNSDFDLFKDQYSQAELPGQFIEAVDLALQNNRPLVGLGAWIDALEHVRRWSCKTIDDPSVNKPWMERRGAWMKRVESTWECFFKSPQAEKIQCPCGDMDGESLREHVRGRALVFEEKCGRSEGWWEENS
ncbi:hypothetical protein N431DRAFT_464056 [Stipitochalara longipes BDJ]|nr:hypothetical protein N431DRAFT_464056 [Stipitochalara longipes BDJ]